VFQMPGQLQHGAHCGLDQPLRRREAFFRARGLGLLLWGGEGAGGGGRSWQPPQEKLHGIRVLVTGCLAQRRTPVGLIRLVDRGAVFQMPTQLQHGAHCGLDQQMRRLGFLPPKKARGRASFWKNQIEGEARTGRMGRGVDKLLDGCLR